MSSPRITSNTIASASESDGKVNLTELADSNARLRMQVATLQAQLDAVGGTQTKGAHVQHFRAPNPLPTSPEDYRTLLYRVDEEEKVAYITLNRPSFFNAIVWPLPWELRDAVQRANDDIRVHAIVLAGSGRGFCSGYDLKTYAESERGTQAGSQKMPWDPYIDYTEMKECTDCYMSLWNSYKPTIAAVHGFAIAGGSDIALSCDMVIMEETARIGYPPARMWGSPTTHHWTYRVGAEQAKRMLLTGDTITGIEAARIGLVLSSVPTGKLASEVLTLTRRMRGIPLNQLFFNKLICNMAAEGADLRTTQKVATLLDGMTRHTPEGVAFQQVAQKQGFQAAIDLLRADSREGRIRPPTKRPHLPAKL